MAASLFRCPHCAGTFQVEPRAKDHQVHCTHCRGLVTIAGMPNVTSQAKPAAAMAAADSVAVQPTFRPKSTSILELEPDSPLLPDRPTAIPQIPKITTPLADLSIHEVLKHGRAHRVSDIHVAPGAPIMFRIA